MSPTRALVFCGFVLSLATPAAAQNEAALRTFFEGKRVTLKIDMPATSSGVDLRVETAQPMDAKQYGDRIRVTGVAIRTGESALVTQVRVKKDLVEFQLGGGGFSGTASVYLPDAPTSNRERDLEKEIRDEKDAVRKRRLQSELSDLVSRRNRENARIRLERARLEREEKARIAVERLTAGSRFNLRYARAVPLSLGPDEVMVALREFVDFAPKAEAPAPSPRIDPMPSASGGGQPRKGMLRAEAERELGRPVTVADRREGTLTVSTVVFVHGEQRITADFVEGVLVRYTIASR